MRTSARLTGAAAAMAAVLLVSGCGSSDDSGKDEEPSAEEPADAGGGDQETDAKPGSVDGVWNTKADGQDFVLSIAGDAVTLVRDDGLCTGRVTDTGKPSLTLKCPEGGGEERTNGTVDSVEAKKLTVSWNGGATDTYVKMADAPKDPADLGDLEDLVPSP